MKRNYLVLLFKLSIITSIVFKAAQLIDRIYNIAIIELVVRGNEKYRNKLHFIFREIKIETIIIYINFLLFLVLLSIWFYLKYKQAHKQTALKLSYKPIWALFSFIIPIFNFVAPYRIMNDLWTVHNRNMSIESWGRKQIKIWWFLTIGIFVFNRYISLRFNQVADLEGYLSLEYYLLALFAISIHYYLLLFRLVKLLDD
jgi:hypothetical protein